ncbi:Slit 2 protein like [Actinidia chinensis var. chinensis]|uniref:Slit 2 protein like n=1 Tax=Actinidia chinensis var. chinensis TaxID=1590841 RepID=A0A2R6PSS6_ACTCC|nr:Slit 2 protein like [Actinidia chinensis var. chinensis]
MGSNNFSHFSLLISLYLLFFSLFLSNITATTPQQLVSNPLQGVDGCALSVLINCGQGKCFASNASVLGFDCECYPGWKKLQIGTWTFPSCVVPNCTLDFQCGNGAPPPPPPPPPPLNLTSPCNLVWCGDGNCVVNGTGHYCQCYDGSSNLLNSPALACFKQCYFGADCDKIGFGPHSPPPSTNSASPGNGPNIAANCSTKLRGLTIIVLSAIFLAWI